MAATTKTLTPTNQTISIPAFTDKPDNRLQTDSTGKLADAVNALSEQIAPLTGDGALSYATDLVTIQQGMQARSTKWMAYANTADNKPDNYGGIVLTYRYSENYGYQFALSDGGIYFRVRSNGAYGTWKAVMLS